MEDLSEINSSAFNEASFKMKRLHELQDKCNELRQSPGRLSSQTGLLFCKMHSDALQSLYLEIASKLSKEEKDAIRPKLLELREITKELNYRFNKYGKLVKGTRKEFNENKESAAELIFDCEELIRDYLDKHGFSTMNAENTEGDQYA